MCKDCFTAKILYKFKIFFNKQKIFFFNKNILIVHNETSILSIFIHLLKECLFQNFPEGSSVSKIYYLYIYGKNMYSI
jgi:hypothetical protein